MICDECIKKDVCKFKDSCGEFETKLEEIASGYGIFGVSVKCGHKQVSTPTPKTSTPLTPGKYPYSPTVPWDKRVTWDGRPEITCR